jgi:hypothetical protein
VRRGYKSYFSKENGGTAEFNKPVLKHHDHEADPIGRITGGQFIKTKTGDAFKNDFLTPDTMESGGKGSGVARLNTEITDADAIAKILDGRLVSVSSGHSSKSLTCSLCSKPLLSPLARLFGADDDESCEHIPGKIYRDDDAKGLCFGITGPLTYHELSFVNIPAQAPARKVDWELIKMTDSAEEPIVVPSLYRGKKSDITSMVLLDHDNELDLLSADMRRVDNKVCVSMAIADKVISSVLDGVSSEDDTAHNAEPEQVNTSKDEGSDTNSRSGGASDASSKRETADSDDATDGRQKSVSTADGSGDNSNGRLGDASSGGNMTDKNDLSVDALQASIESLTQDKAKLEEKVEETATEVDSLKTKLEAKDSEVSRLTDDMSTMQGTLAKDYATIVAQYRILLSKPGTDKLDEKEAKDAFIDELAKRSVESLRDSLSDLAEEYKRFCEEEKVRKDARKGSGEEGVDVSDPKLASPALVDADGADEKEASKQKSGSEMLDEAFTN